MVKGLEAEAAAARAAWAGAVEEEGGLQVGMGCGVRWMVPRCTSACQPLISSTRTHARKPYRTHRPPSSPCKRRRTRPTRACRGWRPPSARRRRPRITRRRAHGCGRSRWVVLVVVGLDGVAYGGRVPQTNHHNVTTSDATIRHKTPTQALTERQEECRALAADARRRLGEVQALVRAREATAKVKLRLVCSCVCGGGPVPAANNRPHRHRPLTHTIPNHKPQKPGP